MHTAAPIIFTALLTCKARLTLTAGPILRVRLISTGQPISPRAAVRIRTIRAGSLSPETMKPDFVESGHLTRAREPGAAWPGLVYPFGSKRTTPRAAYPFQRILITSTDRPILQPLTFLLMGFGCMSWDRAEQINSFTGGGRTRHKRAPNSKTAARGKTTLKTNGRGQKWAMKSKRLVF